MSTLQHSLHTVSDSIASHQYTDGSIMIDSTDELMVPSEQSNSLQKTDITSITAAVTQPLYAKSIYISAAKPASSDTEKAAQAVISSTPSSYNTITAMSIGDSNASIDSVDDIVGLYSRATSLLMDHIMPNISNTAKTSTSSGSIQKLPTTTAAVMTELRDTLTQLDSIDKAFTEVKHSKADQANQGSANEHSSSMKYLLLIVSATAQDKVDICNTLCGGIKVSIVHYIAHHMLSVVMSC
jgi:hypothetical protein